eukprot:1698611-Alexandrium_andersonii.AAC.1
MTRTARTRTTTTPGTTTLTLTPTWGARMGATPRRTPPTMSSSPRRRSAAGRVTRRPSPDAHNR